jgi:Domain of unknown function (DUF5916)/Carbohydrate family 9 binding domain-like
MKKSEILQWRRFICAIVLLSALPAVALATNSVEPVFMPSMETQLTSGKIEIDGELGDSGWSGAGHVSDFVERWPGDNLEPLVSTEAFITYDTDNLYVSFICKDNPDDVRATMCQRDQYNDDDAVGLYIDTFGEAVWAYQFIVNPYGIQKDRIWTSVQGTDTGFDLIWHSAAKITDEGYNVEMAIPLAALRFPDRDVQNWRLDFRRIHPRESYHEYAWAPVDRDEQCVPCQWGSVEGIEGIKPGKGLEILPSFISYQTADIADALDADSGLENHDLLGESSLGAKYSLSSDITLEGTYNPDFSQIEADADQIDVNSTIINLFPERRPFFQEGNDLFRTMFNSFYTRTVNDPSMAAKGTARWDRTSVAYMAARDEHSPYIIPTEEGSYSAAPGKSTVNVIRGLHSLGNNSQIGFMATDRRYDDSGSGTILSADANIRLSSVYSWVGQVVHSDTQEPDNIAVSSGETFDHGEYTVDLDGESYTGKAFITQMRRRSRRWNFTIDYNQLDPTYRTQTGYDPWNDQQNSYVWNQLNFYPEGGIFERVSPNIFVNGRWNNDGQRKWIRYQGNVDMNLRKAQTYLGVRFNTGSEQWGGVEFNDLWSTTLTTQSRPSPKLGFFLQAQVGQGPALRTLDKGDEFSFTAELDYKPIDRLVIEPTFDYVKSTNANSDDLLFKQTIFRARVRYQVNPRLSLRLVLQRNESESPYYLDMAQAGNFPTYHMYFGKKWELDPLLTYRINSLSVFYLGATHDYRDFNAGRPELSSMRRMTGRQYFTKIQYLFQI